MAAEPRTKEAPLEVSSKGPVRMRIVRTDSATATIEIGIDYSQAPVPHLHYDADYCDVVESRTGVALVFGKLRGGKNELRTQIEVAFSAEYFLKHLWAGTRKLHETTRHVTEGRALSDIGKLDEPERVQSLRANNVFIAVLPSESVLDFYFISPGDIHLAQKKQRPEIILEPVVRVVVSTPLFFEFLEKCRPVAEKLSSIFGEEELQNDAVK